MEKEDKVKVMKEQCINCKYCKELYTPPTRTEEAKHEYCCILFLVYNEDSVTNLGTNAFGRCEGFHPTVLFSQNAKPLKNT